MPYSLFWKRHKMFFYSCVIDSQKLISTCGHVDILRVSLSFRLVNHFSRLLVLLIAYSSYCGVIRVYMRQFKLHKTNVVNEELVISLYYRREVQEMKLIYRLLYHYNSLSNKMDNSLLAVRDINHKYYCSRKLPV